MTFLVGSVLPPINTFAGTDSTQQPKFKSRKIHGTKEGVGKIGIGIGIGTYVYLGILRQNGGYDVQLLPLPPPVEPSLLLPILLGPRLLFQTSIPSVSMQ